MFVRLLNMFVHLFAFKIFNDFIGLWYGKEGKTSQADDTASVFSWGFRGSALAVIPNPLWLRLVLVSGLPFLLLFLDFSQNVDVLPAGAEQLRALLTTEAHLCGGVGNFVFEYAHICLLYTSPSPRD